MSDYFPVVIHHNRDCGTSRNVVAFVEACGYAPVVIDYLETEWTRPQLLALFAASGATPRAMLRDNHPLAASLGLLGADVDGETLLEAMVENPILVNRPIVATPRGVRLCRPSEAVFALLDRAPEGPVFKEDGALVTPHDRAR